MIIAREFTKSDIGRIEDFEEFLQTRDKVKNFKYKNIQVFVIL